jgi:excisionase family DNA binding protein
MLATLDAVKDPVTTQQAAVMLDVSLSAVQKAITHGRLKAEQMGRDKLIERDEVERYRRERRLTGPRKRRPPAPSEEDRPAG